MQYMPDILWDNVIARDKFDIDLSNPLQMSGVIEKIIVQRNFSFSSDKEYKKIREDAKLISRIDQVLHYLQKDQLKEVFLSEVKSLKQIYDNSELESKKNQIEKIVANELIILKTFKDKCSGAGCTWLDERIKAFEEGFEQKFSEHSVSQQKTKTLFSPESEKSLLQRLWENIWPTKYFQKNK